jgi:hypothetical protein
MESDVTTTLSELERKLKELERELESVGRGGETDTDPAQAGWTGAEAGAYPGAAPDPGPPPAGATALTATWHGSGPAAAVPLAPPASPFSAPAVAVTPPPAPWPLQAAPPLTPAAPAEPWAPVAPGLHRQLDELLAFRERLVQTTDDLVAELSRVLTELGADVGGDPADTLLTGRVVLEAAPFADLATLSAFEQALVRTPGVMEVYVRALDAGRATIEVDLAGPLPLAAALRHAAPIGFTVAQVGEGHLVLALAPPAR